MQNILPDQLLDRPSELKGRVQSQERFGPEKAAVQLGIDRLAKALASHWNKVADVVGVARNETIPQVENVQSTLLNIPKLY
jgi:hypothetical protein